NCQASNKDESPVRKCGAFFFLFFASAEPAPVNTLKNEYKKKPRPVMAGAFLLLSVTDISG
ncbi:MAG TPA: hypothetical protein DDY50_13335, partial [Erwinia persicina]|nr:hypothetical protein [Erwinia persicina]